MKTGISLLALVLVAGCNTSTPFPSPSPFPGASVSANPYPRGSERFCREYALQTAANQYENQTDSGDDFGASGIARRSAELSGDRAYERCRAGRTG